MRLIIAIIREYHLEFVRPKLERHGWKLTSVGCVVGASGDPGYTLIYREREITVDRPKLRLELIVDDFEVEAAVEVLRAATSAGCPENGSDAKIMVMPLEDFGVPCMRERAALSVSNPKGERHTVAVGS